MTKTTHIQATTNTRRSITMNAACGRMVNGMGFTDNPEKVTCKGCRKNLVNTGVLPY